MEANLINLVGTIGFGGGGIVIVAYIYWKQLESVLRNHKEQIDRLCETHQAELNRVCDSFDRSIDHRDKDINLLVSEIRTIKSGIINA